MNRRTIAASGTAAALFGLNVWIAHRLFVTEFTGLQSNEAAFIAISRFFREHVGDLRWFPWFNAGMPVENAYQPVLPVLTALVNWLSGWPIGRAYHVVLALAYCLGPVTLFWLVLDWSLSLPAAAVAAGLFSLVSPAALAFPAIRQVSGGPLVAQRLFNLVYYGEDPHLVALTLLPVALLFLRRTAARRDGSSFVGAVIFCSAVVLSNAFGALSIAVGAVCVGLALNSGWALIATTGIVSWCLSSPWITPSLIALIRANAFSARGQYADGSGVAAALLLAATGGIWWYSRRIPSSFVRFACLFTPWMVAFPALQQFAGITLVPQAHRYQLEMELAVCLGAGASVLYVRRFKAFALAGILALFVYQTVGYLKFAHGLIRPVRIGGTVEYEVAHWIDSNLKGQRVMVSGDAAWVFNMFSDNPQMSSGHEPTAPNFIQQIAVYQIYSGMNTGDQDADVSLLWLKAFGNQAIVVPGPQSEEVYKPFARPEKFQGRLPVLWRGRGDTIYRIPQRSPSLAHTVPAGSVAARRPVNGLDLEPVREYVRALDDARLPLLEMTCETNVRCKVTGEVGRGQVASLQITYNPGWRARVAGRSAPVREDGLGLMVLDPGCAGRCEIELEFGLTREAWICRLLAGLAAASLVAIAIIASC